MSELWERRITIGAVLALALFCIGTIYGSLAVIGVGTFAVVGYYLGRHERDGLPPH